MDRKTDKMVPKTKDIAECQFKLLEVLENAKTQILYQNVDGAGKGKGKLQFSNCSLRNSYSFFDLTIKNDINLIPVVAVDFSLANLTFDES